MRGGILRLDREFTFHADGLANLALNLGKKAALSAAFWLLGKSFI